MIDKIKYWIPILGILFFYLDNYHIINYLNAGEKYPHFVLYHVVLIMFLLAIIFNLFN